MNIVDNPVLIIKSRRSISTIAIILLVGTALVLLYNSLPPMSDWTQFYRPAALAMLHGQNPYSIQDYHNAPWALIPLIPIALLPDRLGRLCFLVLSLVTCFYLLHQLRAKPLATILFMTSAPIVFMLYFGGIDWMVMLSFITTPALAIFLATIKPQIGLGILLYWFLCAWQRGDIGGSVRRLWRWFMPTVLALGISFLLYGFWVMTFVGKWHNPFNISIFPYLIPIGIYLMISRSKQGAQSVGLMFSPYHTITTLCTLLTALLDHPRLLFIAWCLTWLPSIIYNLPHLAR